MFIMFGRKSFAHIWWKLLQNYTQCVTHAPKIVSHVIWRERQTITSRKANRKLLPIRQIFETKTNLKAIIVRAGLSRARDSSHVRIQITVLRTKLLLSDFRFYIVRLAVNKFFWRRNLWLHQRLDYPIFVETDYGRTFPLFTIHVWSIALSLSLIFQTRTTNIP